MFPRGRNSERRDGELEDQEKVRIKEKIYTGPKDKKAYISQENVWAKKHWLLE